MTQDEATVTVLEQVQRTFLHLRDGKRPCFDAIRLVDACRCLNLQYPVDADNDAGEFCDELLDRVESGMMIMAKPRIAALDGIFGGTFVHQKIPTGCSHHTSRQDHFCNLQVAIDQSESLEESLARSVQATILTGGNQVGKTTTENNRIRGGS